MPASARAHARRLALLALPLLAAACADATESARAPEVHPDGQSVDAMLACTANVAEGTVSCEAPLSGIPASSGARLDARTVGGQGLYVRMTSSNVSNTGGIFAFDATVQNLSNLAMGTADGATRDDAGVRVFFADGPNPTAGAGTVTVGNPTGTDIFLGSEQPFFQYGGNLSGTDQGELGADGILPTAETSTAKRWEFNVTGDVTGFSFTVYVRAETPAGTIVSMAPQVTGVSPATLVPGTTATITGYNFQPTPADNTVQIGGVAAMVTAATPTELQVTVPCMSTGTRTVQATHTGMTGRSLARPLQVTQRTVAVGEMVVASSAADSYCNELTSANGTARYVVSVFNNSASPNSTSPFQLSADGVGAAPQAAVIPRAVDVLGAPRLSLGQQVSLAAAQQSDARHAELLERNREQYAQLRATVGTGARRNGARRNVVSADPPPATRNFRISNIAPPTGQTICSSFYVVSATRVYYDGKIAIYEDDATPDAFRSAMNATMAASYQKIGDQFNADMEPIVRNNFGDILRRDAETDNNGVLVALFSPRVNDFGGVAGFVVTCDQFANNDTTTTAYAPGGPYSGLNSSGGVASNGASNHGEFFYAYQPVVDGTGYASGNTPDNWYRTIRSTFIHEAKHVASHAARITNNAPAYEQSWLEEGTARHVEELWMRNAVDNVAWKANTGYGSFANPINAYCDLRPTAAECLANPRRPSYNMMRHFQPMYTLMYGQNARLLSPFGRTPSDNASYFYAVSWSLVRYAVDRYGTSDAAFLTALNQSTTNGITNLTDRSGVSLDQLLAGWTLSLAVDDHPLLAAAPSADIQFPTWNLRAIYAGLNTDPATSGYSLAYPLVPTAATFGSFTPAAITTLRGGGFVTYEISGTQTAPQLIRVEGASGTATPSTVRVAVTRIQ